MRARGGLTLGPDVGELDADFCSLGRQAAIGSCLLQARGTSREFWVRRLRVVKAELAAVSVSLPHYNRPTNQELLGGLKLRLC